MIRLAPKLPGLVDHHADAAGMLVAVPAAGQVARRKDHARPAAEVDPLQAGRLAERRAVAPLVRQLAELVVGREDRLLGQHFPQRPRGKDQLDLAAEAVGEIVPAATGVAEDRAAVHHVAGQLLPDFVGELELVVPGQQQDRQLAGIEREMAEIDLDRPIVDAQLLGRPAQERDHVGRIGHPVAVLHPLAVAGGPAGRAQGGLAHQRRRAGRPLLLAPPQRSGRQRQRRERFAAGLMMRLGRRRRAAIDRARVAFVAQRQPDQVRRADHAAGRDGQAQPLEELPPKLLS